MKVNTVIILQIHLSCIYIQVNKQGHDQDTLFSNWRQELPCSMVDSVPLKSQVL
jgi:CDP-diacylglycerol pyrophosphatase